MPWPTLFITYACKHVPTLGCFGSTETDTIARAVTKKLFDLDIDRISSPDDAIYKDFRKRVPETDVSTEELVSMGKRAKTSGVAPSTLHQTLSFPGERKVTLGRPAHLIETWNQFENTFPANLDYTNSPSPRNLTTNIGNSCAFEELVTVGVHLGIGLRQGDMMTFAKIRNLTPVQLSFFFSMLLPLRDLTISQRNNAIRSIMRETAKNTCAAYTYGRMVDVNDVASLVLGAFDSCTYTYTEATHFCCNRQELRIDLNHSKETTLAMFQLQLVDTANQAVSPDSTLSEMLHEKYFCQASLDKSNVTDRGDPYTPRTRCALGKQCQQLVRRQNSGLTSLPGFLVASLTGGLPTDERTLETRHAFEDIILQERGVLGKPISVQYMTAAVIFRVNGNHFVSRCKRMKNKTTYLGHDGMRADKCGSYKSWMGGMQQYTQVRVSMIFYERIGEC